MSLVQPVAAERPQLYSEQHGHGPVPLVCVHGWGMNLRAFDGLCAALNAHTSVWTIDLPGHGKSPWWPARADFVEQTQVLAAMLPPKCVLLGWSLGGQFALEIARQIPTQVVALILVTTTPRFAQSPDWPHGLSATALATFHEMLEQDWQRTLDDFIWLQLRGSRNAEAAHHLLAQALLTHGAPSTAALACDLNLLASVDQRADVAHITQSALVISGQNDRVTPSGAAAWLAKTMPHAKHVEIARAGHAPFVSHAEEFLLPVRAFLAETLTQEQGRQ